MRLLHVHSGNMYGGVETLLLTLARVRHSRPATESHFALCFDGRLRVELRAEGAAVHALGNVRASRPLSVRRARRELRALLATYRFDAVVCHAPWAHAVFAPAVRAEGLPLVFWMHAPASGTHWLERWARLTPPRLVVCNSRFTAASSRRLFPHAPAEVVYCPVAAPSPRSPLGAVERAEVRAQLGTPEDATVIVQVSRMEGLKGHGAHLAALARLRDVPHWVCWLVGGGERPDEVKYARGLRDEAARLGIDGRVRFTGERADVARLLAAADIYCQPNAAPESFGISLVEALYAGLPVVTTDAGGALEIVEESCGMLVSVGDADALACALRRLIEDSTLRRELGARGPARAAELCDPERQLGRLEEIFARLAHRRREAA